tara:strand:+ start:858 stop:1280 length:423 start_codon:yes stop_codon:yes gene_type:complete
MLLSTSIPVLSFLLAFSTGGAHSSYYCSQADYDRWIYSFNGPPGFWIESATFSAYTLKSLSVEISTSSNDIVFDPTLVARQTHINDTPADLDSGRAVCLSGVGFRGNLFDPENMVNRALNRLAPQWGRNAYQLARRGRLG